MQLVESDVNKSGYVYVLSNPSMPGLIKVGHSVNGGHSRASSMFSGDTGVPTPFVLEFEAYVKDRKMVESTIHEMLEEFRVNKNREFFNCEAGRAVRMITNMCRTDHVDIDHQKKVHREADAARVLQGIETYKYMWELGYRDILQLHHMCWIYLVCGLDGDWIYKALNESWGISDVEGNLKDQAREYMGLCSSADLQRLKNLIGDE